MLANAEQPKPGRSSGGQDFDRVESDAVILEHLGDVYRELGRLDDAVDAWSDALIAEPDRESTRERLRSAGEEIPDPPSPPGDTDAAGQATETGGDR